MPQSIRLTIGYRAKGKGIGAAFALTNTHLSWLFPSLARETMRVAAVVDVRKDTNGDVTGRYLHLKPHPEGFLVNFKYPESPTGEISIAYNVLDVQPRVVTEGGTLTCRPSITMSGKHMLIANLDGWRAHEDAQDTLFGETGRLLLPGARGVPDLDPVNPRAKVKR